MPPSPDALPDRPLAESIAVATRSSHTRLNKSIIARLPMVTRATDSSSYITGLLHIAPIYLTFEACWDVILETPPSQHVEGEDTCGTAPTTRADDGDISTASSHASVRLQKPVVCDRLRTLLQQLQLPGLMRSGRLRADIRALTGWTEDVVEEQLRIAGECGRLGEFTAHIKRSIEHRPQALVAYSYILFMALFAGGRFIRATLESAGDSFWNDTPSPVKPSMLECSPQSPEVSPTSDSTANELGTPLSFFRFATPEDGEDLKREFKGRLLEAETILTQQEKHDIVQESVCIFDNMELLVGQLDKICAADGDSQDGTSIFENLSSLMGKSVAMRLRNSVAVTKDRAARSSSRMSSSTDSDDIGTVYKPRKSQGLDAATSTSGLSSTSVPGHPIVPANLGGIELCPALKSMRFESNLPLPVRAVTEATEGLKRFNYTNWLVIAAFSAIIIGAIVTTRREMTIA